MVVAYDLVNSFSEKRFSDCMHSGMDLMTFILFHPLRLETVLSQRLMWISHIWRWLILRTACKL
jgi:hypothetical protein